VVWLPGLLLCIDYGLCLKCSINTVGLLIEGFSRSSKMGAAGKKMLERSRRKSTDNGRTMNSYRVNDSVVFVVTV
jgi:hypothetical protein